jgi:hypothetical protein
VVRSFARAWHAAAVLVAVIAVGRQLGAQVSAAADLGGMVHRTGADLWRSTSRADPAVRVDGRWTQLSGDADIWGGGEGSHLQHGSVDLLAAPAPFGPFRLTTTAHVERTALSPGLTRTVGTIESALSLRVASGGGWLGLASENAREIDSASWRPQLRAGLWKRFGLMIVSVNAESHRARLGGRSSTIRYQTLPGYTTRDSTTGDSTYHPERTIALGDSGAPSRLWNWSDLQARVGWTTGRVSLDARFGVQPKVDVASRSFWAHGVATVALAPRLSLVAGGGVQPSTVWLGTPSSRFVSIGLRVAPASLVQPAPPPFVRPNAASFVMRRADGDTAGTAYVVTVRVPSARAVELSGDFSGWHPIELRLVGPDLWETSLALVRGTHRINMRINGDSWVTPPGLPTTDDDFNGTVGLIVVR